MEKLGIGISGSFCNLKTIKDVARELAQVYDITFFLSDNIKVDTRFGTFADLKAELEEISKKELVDTLVEAEKYGPQIKLDLMLIMPCSASTLNKLSQGIYDNPLLLGTKAHLRACRPVVLAIASNDYLGISGKNLFAMINQKDLYFVPFGQDDYVLKPHSLVADFTLVPQTLELAKRGIQIQPLLITYTQKGENK